MDQAEQPVKGSGDEEGSELGLRSVAQLTMLNTLANKLNQLTDEEMIGTAITTELHGLIDYHSCRVYLLQPNSQTLSPVAIQGEELTEYEEDSLEDLVVEIGEGLTGHVAESRGSYYSPNALEDPFAVDIPGTDDVVESMMGVPLIYIDDLVGVIVLSKLGFDQFDESDMRVLQVLSPHAAVAIVNARLLQEARQSAQISSELLNLSKALTDVRDEEEVLAAARRGVPAMMRCSQVLVYVRGEDGDFAALPDDGQPGQEPRIEFPPKVPAAVAAQFLTSLKEPFVLPGGVLAALPDDLRPDTELRDVIVAPLSWQPNGIGALVILGESAQSKFSDADISLTRGIIDIASLALSNAGRFEQLEESRNQLRALDDMKTMFLEAVSHDLRTPLASVLGIALTLTEADVDLSSDDSRDLLGRLAANARKLERLLADLLDLDRLTRGIVSPNRRATDLAALVGDVVEAEESLASRKVVLELESIIISIDGPKIERIIDNLLVNSVRHTPESATVWVRVTAENGGALIAVEDDGPGIPPDSWESIFEAFSQGPSPNRHSPGVGIGLSLVRRFAELHDGRAWVQNREGGGSSFRVYLPSGPLHKDSFLT